MIAAEPHHPTLIDRVMTWFRERHEAHECAAELARLGPAELDRIAEDLCIDRNQLLAIAGEEASCAELLDRMLELHGLDPETLSHEERAVMKDMQVVCSQCHEKRHCRHDLDAGATVETVDAYCPNAPTMAALNQQS